MPCAVVCRSERFFHQKAVLENGQWVCAEIEDFYEDFWQRSRERAQRAQTLESKIEGRRLSSGDVAGLRSRLCLEETNLLRLHRLKFREEKSSAKQDDDLAFVSFCGSFDDPRFQRFKN